MELIEFIKVQTIISAVLLIILWAIILKFIYSKYTEERREKTGIWNSILYIWIAQIFTIFLILITINYAVSTAELSERDTERFSIENRPWIKPSATLTLLGPENKTSLSVNIPSEGSDAEKLLIFDFDNFELNLNATNVGKTPAIIKNGTVELSINGKLKQNFDYPERTFFQDQLDGFKSISSSKEITEQIFSQYNCKLSCTLSFHIKLEYVDASQIQTLDAPKYLTDANIIIGFSENSISRGIFYNKIE